MARYYLMTTLAGLYLLDRRFKMVLRRDFPKLDRVYEGRWLDAERELLAEIRKRDPEASVVAVGKRRGESQEGMEATDDPKVRMRCSVAILQQDPSWRERMHDANLDLTQRGIESSFSEDQLIINSVRFIDDLNRALGMLGKRFREWLSLHRPGLERKIPDAERLAEVFSKESEHIDEKMGAKLAKEDIEHLRQIGRELRRIYGFRERERAYLEEKMKTVCPNISALAGEQIGARLLSIAGSLERMATLPASTVQLLGAEQALFRHLKNPRSRPPKYGILHEHPLIQKSKKSDHGKVARMLADKIALAARVDYFRGDFVADRLRKEIEERFGIW